MKKTGKIAALLMAATLSLSSFGVYAANETAPGYKLVNTYDEDKGIITSELYVTGGIGGVGQLGIYYDTELLSLAATVDKNLTADYDISTLKMSNFAEGVKTDDFTVTPTAETNSVSKLINEEEGKFFFAWYSGATSNVDASEKDMHILTFKFVLEDGVDSEALEKSGLELIKFADSKPDSDSGIRGYNSGVYCSNEMNTAFRNSSDAKNQITLSVEFKNLDIKEESNTVTVTVKLEDGTPVEGAYVKIGSQEVVTDKNGKAKLTVTGSSYTVSYKYSKNDEYVILSGDKTEAIVSAPAKMSAPTVSAGTEQLSLKWEKPSSGGSDITKYIVSLKAGSSTTEKLYEYDADALKATITSLTGGTKYTVKIKAVNAIGEGEYSAEKTATPTKSSSGTTGSSGSNGGTTTTTYTVTYDVGSHGTITSGSKTESVIGGKYPSKLPTVTAASGYKFLGWSKTSGGTVIDPTTVKITSTTKFYAVYEEEKTEQNNSGSTSTQNPFTDVKQDDWFYEYVISAYNNNLMNGVSASVFDPNGNVTRAMFVTVLYRMEDSPENDGNTKFTDVEAGSWYDKAVAWGSANGIINGISETEFAPTENITREQVAAILYRYAVYKKWDVTQGGMMIREFDDFELISDYAVTAMTWAVNVGLMNGKGNNLIAPQDTATRAEAATLFIRFIGMTL